MKNLNLLLIYLLLISCTATSGQDDLLTTTTTKSIFDNANNNFLVKDFENLPNALVRIEVKSIKVEPNEEFELTTYEYEGSGSGFFISNDGYIITNNHVISGAVTIEVYTQYRSQPYSAKLIGLSECDDIAVLKIDIENANFLEYSQDNPKLGEEIIAAGFPLGDKEVTYLDGIVSKKETDGSTSWASIDYAFEHTAEILPGSSGGPIVNKDVQVIGIAYAGNVDRQEFGIPINTVKKIIEQIIDKNFEYSFKANLEQFYGIGLYVYSVESDSSLRKVGFKGGEIITHIKGLDISQEETIKIYCDTINSRDMSSGISFKGIDLDSFEEINVEVSLDGSIAKSSDNIFAADDSNNSNTTTTTKLKDTATTTTIVGEVKNEYLNLPVPELIRVNTHTTKTSELPYWSNNNGQEIAISLRIDTKISTNWNLFYDVWNRYDTPVYDVSFAFRGGDCSLELANTENTSYINFPDNPKNELRITVVGKQTSDTYKEKSCWNQNKIPLHSITIELNWYDFKGSKAMDLPGFIVFVFGDQKSCGISEEYDCSELDRFVSENGRYIILHNWNKPGTELIPWNYGPETNNPIGFISNGLTVDNQIWTYFDINSPAFDISDK